MILHLLKDPVDPLAIHTITAESVTSAPTPVVVLLSPMRSIPQLPSVTLYRMTENPLYPHKGEIGYPRLVELIFEADKVIAW
jgi:hypothetical protein